METLQLRVGDDVTLRLPGRGTAGYSWVYEASGAVAALSVSHTTAPLPLSEPPRTGSADEVFLLHGLSPGRVELHFELRRTWDQAAPAAGQRDYVIDVVR